MSSWSDDKAEADWVAETEAEPRVPPRFGTVLAPRGLRAVVVVRRLEAAREGFEADAAVRP